jgi:hypothetical protein
VFRRTALLEPPPAAAASSSLDSRDFLPMPPAAAQEDDDALQRSKAAPGLSNGSVCGDAKLQEPVEAHHAEVSTGGSITSTWRFAAATGSAAGTAQAPANSRTDGSTSSMPFVPVLVAPWPLLEPAATSTGRAGQEGDSDHSSGGAAAITGGAEDDAGSVSDARMRACAGARRTCDRDDKSDSNSVDAVLLASVGSLTPRSIGAASTAASTAALHAAAQREWQRPEASEQQLSSSRALPALPRATLEPSQDFRQAPLDNVVQTSPQDSDPASLACAAQASQEGGASASPQRSGPTEAPRQHRKAQRRGSAGLMGLLHQGASTDRAKAAVAAQAAEAAVWRCMGQLNTPLHACSHPRSRGAL